MCIRFVPYLLSLLIALSSMLPAADSFIRERPLRGVSSAEPAQSWEYAFLSGNGEMGVMDGGHPDETLVVSHARLFLPVNPVPDLPDLADTLPELRRLITEEGYRAALDYQLKVAAERGYERLLFTNPFHPAFELELNPAGEAPPLNYLRSTNFQNGEVTTEWTADSISWRRRVFVSRPDRVLVVSLQAREAATGDAVRFDTTLSLPPVPDSTVRAFLQNRGLSEPVPEAAANRLIDSSLSVSPEGFRLHNHYRFDEGALRGYDAAIALHAPEADVAVEGRSLRVHNAGELLLVARIEVASPGTPDQSERIHGDLAELPADYDRLLERHAAVHGELMDRVQVDFGGRDDYRMPSEQLIARAHATNTISPALLEKIYDGSRYTILSSSGLRPPNLQGIWTGTWEPAWSGDYTTDTNLQLAIGHYLSSRTPELLEGYFSLVEDSLEDWRLNARQLYGARGLHAPTRQSDNARMFHWNQDWPLHFWTPGAAWMAHWFFAYAAYTGDDDFLRERALPFMEEAALFYEDFLFTDDAGHLRFSPSYSAENGTGDNSTQDISILRELLANLITTSERLEFEHAKLNHWKSMLETLPPYVVAENGELQEWATPGVPNANNHRHMMHLYGLFQSDEFDPAKDPQLWEAAEKAYLGRLNGWFRNPENVASHRNNQTSSHGRMHLALSAARLGRGEDIWEIFTRMAAYGAIYPSMATAHYERGSVFNMDANGAIPQVINEALLRSTPGQLKLLPALPEAMQTGEVRGLAAHRGLTVERLDWSPRHVRIELRSPEPQSIVIQPPQGDPVPVTLEADVPQSFRFSR